MESKDYLSLTKYLLNFILMISCFATAKMEAQVTIAEEPEVTALLNTYKMENSKVSFVRAWRIQILTTNDRREMEQGIRRFERLYPHINYDWEHNPPYYQVRVGHYELKSDLEAFLLELKREFPSALPVQAQVSKTKLLED